MEFSIISVVCGIAVFLAAIIYFIADIKQNYEKIDNVITYFVARFIIALLAAVCIANLIAL